MTYIPKFKDLASAAASGRSYCGRGKYQKKRYLYLIFVPDIILIDTFEVKFSSVSKGVNFALGFMLNRWKKSSIVSWPPLSWDYKSKF